MAHSISKTNIFNKALILLGAAPVASDTDNLKTANTLREIYDLTRLAVLQAHEWNFAQKRAIPSLAAGTPAFDWDYQFTKPGDCLKVNESYLDVEFKVEGDLILANSDVIKIRYTADITATAQFSPLFMETLAARLASDSAERIINSTEAVQLTFQLYKDKLAEARSKDSQEGTPDDIGDDDWVNSRW